MLRSPLSFQAGLQPCRFLTIIFCHFYFLARSWRRRPRIPIMATRVSQHATLTSAYILFAAIFALLHHASTANSAHSTPSFIDPDCSSEKAPTHWKNADGSGPSVAFQPTLAANARLAQAVPAPQFTDTVFSFSVVENTAVGTIVYISNSTGDSSRRYSITTGSSPGVSSPFSIQAVTGAISVAGSINYEVGMH